MKPIHQTTYCKEKIGDLTEIKSSGKTFVSNTLGGYMNANEFEKEYGVEKSTPEDVRAFTENPPEGADDGNLNLFLVEHFVVSVYWHALAQEWGVGCGRAWNSNGRVFSPVTVSQALDSEPLTLSKAIEMVKDAGYIVMKQV